MATGGYKAYDLVGNATALVYSVCADPMSHDFFLVPIGSVTPFVAESDLSRPTSSLTKDQVEQVKTKQEIDFHKTYGGVKRGLFNILYDKKVICLEQDVDNPVDGGDW